MAFIKPFEVPQRSMKIKIKVNFFSLTGFGTGRIKASGSPLLFPQIGFEL